MKKMIFYLSLVLGFFHTLDANALEVTPAHAIQLSKQESTHVSQHSKSQNLFFAEQLIDIEEDEITDPSSNIFSVEKTAIKSHSFYTTGFHSNFFRNILANQHFHHRQSSYFISLRVLKL
jgi:hypothetical protein